MTNLTTPVTLPCGVGGAASCPCGVVASALVSGALTENVTAMTPTMTGADDDDEDESGAALYIILVVFTYRFMMMLM